VDVKTPVWALTETLDGSKFEINTVSNGKPMASSLEHCRLRMEQVIQCEQGYSELVAETGERKRKIHTEVNYSNQCEY
jgi:hypothetical protein